MVLLSLVLAFFILYPPIVLFMQSFSPSTSQRGLAVFEVLGHKGTWVAFLNSLVTSLFTTALTFLIGLSLAWLEVKSNFRFKKAIRSFTLVAFIIPHISWLSPGFSFLAATATWKGCCALFSPLMHIRFPITP